MSGSASTLILPSSELVLVEDLGGQQQFTKSVYYIMFRVSLLAGKSHIFTLLLLHQGAYPNVPQGRRGVEPLEQAQAHSLRPPASQSAMITPGQLTVLCIYVENTTGQGAIQPTSHRQVEM